MSIRTHSNSIRLSLLCTQHIQYMICFSLCKVVCACLGCLYSLSYWLTLMNEYPSLEDCVRVCMCIHAYVTFYFVIVLCVAAYVCACVRVCVFVCFAVFGTAENYWFWPLCSCSALVQVMKIVLCMCESVCVCVVFLLMTPYSFCFSIWQYPHLLFFPPWF